MMCPPTGCEADSVNDHIAAIYRDLIVGRTEHFTDTDWWIMQWAGYLDA